MADRVKPGQVWAGTHPVTKKPYQDATVINVTDEVELRFLDGTTFRVLAQTLLTGKGWKFVREG